MELKKRLMKKLKEIVEHDAYIGEVYLGEYEGCLPEGYIDDVLFGVRNKFAYLVNAVKEAVKEDLGFTGIPLTVIDPSYESETIVTLILPEEKKLLYVRYQKAWHLRFENEDELVEELVEIYKKIKDNL